MQDRKLVRLIEAIIRTQSLGQSASDPSVWMIDNLDITLASEAIAKLIERREKDDGRNTETVPRETS